jgi:hypothetical protein
MNSNLKEKILEEGNPMSMHTTVAPELLDEINEAMETIGDKDTVILENSEMIIVKISSEAYKKLSPEVLLVPIPGHPDFILTF